MRKTGYAKVGAMMNAAVISRKAMASLRAWPKPAMVEGFVAAASISGTPSKQARGPHQQHDGHDHEDHGVGGLRVVNLGQAFDEAEPEAGDDRTHDGTHTADHNHREHHDDQVSAHLPAHVGNRPGHPA